MHELLDNASGKWLASSDYSTAFGKDFWRIKKSGFWKLERQQTFQEPDRDSWLAFNNGDWPQALRLIDEERPETERYFHRIAEAGFRTRRVRVLEYPISPYLHWELHLLRMEARYGEDVSIVRGDQIEQFEKTEQLPELVTLGSRVMYQVVYHDDGTLAGGFRFTDRKLVARCRRFIQSLHQSGEELKDFFEREVTLWEPPVQV